MTMSTDVVTADVQVSSSTNSLSLPLKPELVARATYDGDDDDAETSKSAKSSAAKVHCLPFAVASGAAEQVAGMH